MEPERIAELRSLAIALVQELESLSSKCEAARLKLTARLSEVLDDLGEFPLPEHERIVVLLRDRYASMSTAIDMIYARKCAALEAEQVRVDGALELVATLHADSAALFETLKALPRAPVEPSEVRLDIPAVDDSDVPLESRVLSRLGRLVAVRPASASEVSVTSLQPFARAGKPLLLLVHLSSTFGQQLDASDDIPGTLTVLSRHLEGSISVSAPAGADPIVASASDATAETICDVEVNSVKSFVEVRFELPVILQVGWIIRASISVAGKDAVTVEFPVILGLPPGLRLSNDVVQKEDYCCPAVSSSGVIYRPTGVAHTGIERFSSAGIRLAPLLPVTDLMLSSQASVVAVATAETAEEGRNRPLLLACTFSTYKTEVPGASLAAFAESSEVEGGSVSLVWKTHIKGCMHSFGVAALPRHGVVAVGSCADDGFIGIFDFSTGKERARAPARYGALVAADDKHGFVYASANWPRGTIQGFGISMFRWDGSELISEVR